MMAPGFLSPGGKLPANLAQDQLVAIHAEGKEHACGIGKMSAGSEEIRKAGKGVAVEVLCWIGWVLVVRCSLFGGGGAERLVFGSCLVLSCLVYPLLYLRQSYSPQRFS